VGVDDLADGVKASVVARRVAAVRVVANFMVNAVEWEFDSLQIVRFPTKYRNVTMTADYFGLKYVREGNQGKIEGIT
jgi:hypothetical protein